jgi:hypothetical protein
MQTVRVMLVESNSYMLVKLPESNSYVLVMLTESNSYVKKTCISVLRQVYSKALGQIYCWFS